ncbi:HAMP domain-containing protein [Microcoleus vaginatus]|uniref:HAMP domain-containing protein n=1 Tax=Microcoleus vaginatus TaxID=119532 RepID=UPI000310EE61
MHEEAEALEKKQLFLQLAIIITALAVLGAGGFTWILTSRLVRPIADLTVAAALLSGGDWNQRVNIYRPDELGTLAQALNQMLCNCKSYFLAGNPNITKQKKFATKRNKLAM